MNISNNTLSILKNFATINSCIVLKGGSEIKTMPIIANILAKASIPECIPDGEIGIYDLNEFLTIVNMFDLPEFNFSDDMKYVTITEGKRSVKYHFADTSVLKFPEMKNVMMPKAEVTFSLTSNELNMLRKASSTLGSTDIVIYGEKDSNRAFAKIVDIKNSTSNSFVLELTDVNRLSDSFNFIYDISNLKMISGDYDVSISSKLISHFKNKNNPIEYWIALEKSSTYGV